MNIMQVYRIVCIVTALLVVSSRGTGNEDCSVPRILFGHVEELKLKPKRYNWWKFRFERKITFEKVPVGSSSSDNATLFLACNEDYFVQAAGKSRAPIICSNGKWSPDPVCLTRKCLVPLILNGEIHDVRFHRYRCRFGLSSNKSHLTPGTLVKNNSRLSLVCDENYSFPKSGVSTVPITCSEGKLLPDPVCIRNILCPIIDEKDTFLVVYNNNRKVNSTATFYCKDIYKVIPGARFVTCRSNGEWSYLNPECKVPVCEVKDFVESAPKNMILNLKGVKGDQLPSGSELPLLCRGNLILSGNPKAKCGRSGKWLYGRAQCIIGCYLDSASSELIIEPSKKYFSLGESAKLSCPFGLKLTSNAEVLVCMGISWSNKIPECE